MKTCKYCKPGRYWLIKARKTMPLTLNSVTFGTTHDWRELRIDGRKLAFCPICGRDLRKESK